MMEMKAEKRAYKVDQKLISRRVSDASTRKPAFPTPCTKWRQEQYAEIPLGRLLEQADTRNWKIPMCSTWL